MGLKVVSRFFCHTGYMCARFIFSLRYKVKVRGIKAVDQALQKSKKGAIFLPNHTAFLDPLMMAIWFWPRYRIRPLVVEYVYRMPAVKFIIDLVSGITIPNFDTSINQFKIKRAEQSFAKILNGISKKENFLIYPSGKVKTQPKEVIGGASGVYDLLQKDKDIGIILVRISGFYGSSFSKANSSTSPDFGRALKQHILTIFKNGIFFTPRRKIYVDLEPAPADFPKNGSKTEMNAYLERWYNQYKDDQNQIHESEPLKLVSYSLWKHQVPQIAPENSSQQHAPSITVSEETKTAIYSEIRKILENRSLEIRPEMYLGQDLGMDSLNIAELMSFLLEKYEVKTHSVNELLTVQSVLEFAEGGRLSKSLNETTSSNLIGEEKGRPDPQMLEENTMPDAFLNACARMGNYIAISDDRVGNLSYKKCKKIVLVLAEYFRSIPDKNIGVLLPSSATTYLLILALQLAGKVPVMLNWTLGPRNLEKTIELAQVNHIFSSWLFIEKLYFVDFGSAVEKIRFLEDVKSKISLKMKLKGILSPKNGNLSENDLAVILFTSGTESHPKGVPLTHKNILSQLKAAFPGITAHVDAHSGWYAFLPPFHSFGFTCASFGPLLFGIRMACSPDPTDGLSLAAGIKKWKMTHISIVQSFLRRMLQVATRDQLNSLRIVMTGGEKTPPDLESLVSKFSDNIQMLEGYGVTECAPLVAMQRVDKPKIGVGELLPCLEAITIDPESHSLLKEGETGEICIHGQNVFSGYLGSVEPPFIELHMKKWYRTGDIGRITPERFLILSGRLKRFIKIGGEMISLGAVEECLSSNLMELGLIQPEKAAIALCADESDSLKPRLILYTTVPLEIAALNEVIKKGGFSNLVKISAVEMIKEIPVLATGKTNYRALSAPS